MFSSLTSVLVLFVSVSAATQVHGGSGTAATPRLSCAQFATDSQCYDLCNEYNEALDGAEAYCDLADFTCSSALWTCDTATEICDQQDNCISAFGHEGCVFEIFECQTWSDSCWDNVQACDDAAEDCDISNNTAQAFGDIFVQTCL